MTLLCPQHGRVPLIVLLVTIRWMHMVRGQSQSRCQLKLLYPRSTVYTMEGGTFSLTCTATYCEKSSSKPELNWCKQTSKGCRPLLHLEEFANQTKTIVYLESGTLTSFLQISPVQVNHTGIYQCQAQFPSFSPVTVMGHMITVLVIKIKMFTPVTEVSGPRGGSLKLQCIVQFDEYLNSTLTVHWTKDNENCNESLSRYKTNNQTIATDKHRFTLTLSNLQSEDAGLFHCCATSHLSPQIIGMGSICVHVYAFNLDLLNLSSLVICKGIVLVIIITVGLTWVYKQKRHQQKPEDATVTSVRKVMSNNSIV